MGDVEEGRLARILDVPGSPWNEQKPPGWRNRKEAAVLIGALRESGVELVTVERLADALERTGHVGDGHQRALSEGLDPREHDDPGCLFRPQSKADAAVIFRALREADPS